MADNRKRMQEFVVSPDLLVCSDSFHFIVLYINSEVNKLNLCNSMMKYITEQRCLVNHLAYFDHHSPHFIGIRTDNLSINLAVPGLAIKYDHIHLASIDFAFLSPNVLCSCPNIKLF